MLSLTWVVYVYRDILPLGTTTRSPADAHEGTFLWAKFAILTIATIVIPVLVPRPPLNTVRLVNMRYATLYFSYAHWAAAGPGGDFEQGAERRVVRAQDVQLAERDRREGAPGEAPPARRAAPARALGLYCCPRGRKLEGAYCYPTIVTESWWSLEVGCELTCAVRGSISTRCKRSRSGISSGASSLYFVSPVPPFMNNRQALTTPSRPGVRARRAPHRRHSKSRARRPPIHPSPTTAAVSLTRTPLFSAVYHRPDVAARDAGHPRVARGRERVDDPAVGLARGPLPWAARRDGVRGVVWVDDGQSRFSALALVLCISTFVRDCRELTIMSWCAVIHRTG